MNTDNTPHDDDGGCKIPECPCNTPAADGPDVTVQYMGEAPPEVTEMMEHLMQHIMSDSHGQQDHPRAASRDDLLTALEVLYRERCAADPDQSPGIASLLGALIQDASPADDLVERILLTAVVDILDLIEPTIRLDNYLLITAVSRVMEASDWLHRARLESRRQGNNCCSDDDGDADTQGE